MPQAVSLKLGDGHCMLCWWALVVGGLCLTPFVTGNGVLHDVLAGFPVLDLLAPQPARHQDRPRQADIVDAW
jgi:hypothetical protein